MHAGGFNVTKSNTLADTLNTYLLRDIAKLQALDGRRRIWERRSLPGQKMPGGLKKRTWKISAYYFFESDEKQFLITTKRS